MLIGVNMKTIWEEKLFIMTLVSKSTHIGDLNP